MTRVELNDKIYKEVGVSAVIVDIKDTLCRKDASGTYMFAILTRTTQQYPLNIVIVNYETENYALFCFNNFVKPNDSHIHLYLKNVFGDDLLRQVNKLDGDQIVVYALFERKPKFSNIKLVYLITRKS